MEQKRYLDYEGLRYVVEHLRKEINTTENTLRNEINATEPSTISDFSIFSFFNGINGGLPPVVEDFDFIRHYYGTLSPIELVNVNSKVYKSALYSNALGFSVIGIQGSKFVGETDKYTEFIFDNGIDSSLKAVAPMSDEEYSEYQRINEDASSSFSSAFTKTIYLIDATGYKEVDSPLPSDEHSLIHKFLITEIKGVSSFEFFLYLGYRGDDADHSNPGAGSQDYLLPIVLVSSDFKNSIFDKKPIVNSLPVEEDINEYINRANSISKETLDKVSTGCVRFVITDLDPNCSYFIINGNSHFGPWKHPFPIEPTGEVRLFFHKNPNDMNCSFDPTQVLASEQAINIPDNTNETE